MIMKRTTLLFLALFPLILLAQHPVFVSEKMEKFFVCKPGTVERKVISYSQTNSDSSFFIAIKNADKLEKNLFIPSSCTPNGDGLNDQVQLPDNQGAVQKLMIFDKDGQLLFLSSLKEQFWTGSASPSGMYVYYLEVKLKSGEKVIQKGNISLVK